VKSLVSVYAGGAASGLQGWRSPRNIAGVSGPALTPAIIGKFALGFAALAGSLEGKEAWPTPGRAGDGARDRREAGKCGSLPLEAVADGRDGVASALVFANENGPRLELATWQALVSREAFQKPQAVAIKTAKSSLLQARGNHVAQQVLIQTSGRRPSEHQPPLPPQRIEPERTDALDLGRDRGRLSPAPPHDQTPGRVTVKSDSMASGSPSPAIR
jgi:hypothetical protein